MSTDIGLPRRVWAAGIAVMALVVSLAYAPARASGVTAVLEDCTEMFLLVDGDESALRAAVPPEYVLGTQPPLGDIWSITSSCAGIRVGDGPSRPGTVTFLGAGIEGPEPGGSNPIHSYVFWIATSDRPLGRALRTAGFPVSILAGIEHTFAPGVALPHSNLNVPVEGNAYRIATGQSPLTTHPHAHDAYWWVNGDLGPQRVVVHHSEFAEHIADCGIATDEGTKLSELLGAEQRATPCFLQGPTDSTIEL
ncbi:MAG: hypothetical protein ABR505_07555 [Actinomycetota bacterium]